MSSVSWERHVGTTCGKTVRHSFMIKTKCKSAFARIVDRPEFFAAGGRDDGDVEFCACVLQGSNNLLDGRVLH